METDLPSSPGKPRPHQKPPYGTQRPSRATMAPASTARAPAEAAEVTAKMRTVRGASVRTGSHAIPMLQAGELGVWECGRRKIWGRGGHDGTEYRVTGRRSSVGGVLSLAGAGAGSSLLGSFCSSLAGHGKLSEQESVRVVWFILPYIAFWGRQEKETLGIICLFFGVKYNHLRIADWQEETSDVNIGCCSAR